ncbi:glycoside hydrolase family 43 protein [Amanita muscaria]
MVYLTGPQRNSASRSNMRSVHFISLLAPIVLAIAGYANTEYPESDVVVGDISVHDPSICKDNAGKYWLFSTSVGLEIRTSNDLSDWKLIGKVFPNGAPWADKYNGKSNGELSTPDCTYHDGQFYLYYSAGSPKGFDSATALPGSWSNEGLVTSTSFSTSFTATVPNFHIDKGLWWLAFGGTRTGIKLVQLNPSTGKPYDPKFKPISIATRIADYTGIEGSNIYKHGNYYYLFTTWDHCCLGIGSTYNIRVGRSWALTGPYLDKGSVPMLFGGGSVVLDSHDNIKGPGGQDILVDKDDVYLIYHYYTKTGYWLNFTSGWPVVV